MAVRVPSHRLGMPQRPAFPPGKRHPQGAWTRQRAARPPNAVLWAYAHAMYDAQARRYIAWALAFLQLRAHFKMHVADAHGSALCLRGKNENAAL